MNISFDKKTVTWEDVEVSMKQRGFLQDRKNVQYIYDLYQETFAVEAAEARVYSLLDSDDSKLDINELIKSYE